MRKLSHWRSWNQHIWHFCIQSHSNSYTIIKLVFCYFSVNPLLHLLINHSVLWMCSICSWLHCFYFSDLSPPTLHGWLVTTHTDGLQLYLFYHHNCHTPRYIIISISIISIPHSLLSRCIRAISIPNGWPPSREAHFLILELPESQKLTGPGQPIRAQQAQPPSCLQEVDARPFVFGFYKRKFCRGLPGRTDEANTHTHITPFHSIKQKLQMDCRYKNWHKNINICTI